MDTWSLQLKTSAAEIYQVSLQSSWQERGSARGVSGAIGKRGTFSGDRGRSGVGKSSLSLNRQQLLQLKRHSLIQF